MSSQTSENEQTLSKILDALRMGGILILLLHFYFFNYTIFRELGLTCKLGDNGLNAIGRTGLFLGFNHSKIIALALLIISLMGARGKKDPNLTPEVGLRTMAGGLILYFGSYFIGGLDLPPIHLAILYMLCTVAGFILVLHGGNQISRIIYNRLKSDPFNRRSQNFPQEERLLQNEYSIHFPAEYEYNGQIQKSYINIVNPFRANLVLGSPGAGKTTFIIDRIIKQQIQMGFSMLVYDYKYPGLSKVAYNYFLLYKDVYPGQPAHYHINFEDLNRTNRCNCLAPYTLPELADAVEAARSFLLGLNMDWISKQGDFWVESSVNFVSGIIWFLRKYREGKYCSWPHVIELASVSYKDLFSVLRGEIEIQTLIKPFVDAFLQGNHEQLGGQVGSANIGMARLSSPALYYVLTGNDFTLDLNNPEYPKVLTLANSPQKTTTYGAFLSVIINTVNRLAARVGQHPLGQVIDEASTIAPISLIQSIGQGRGYKIAVTLAYQDASQIKLVYGNKYADVIMNLCGNIISGQVSGETAKWLSDRFGRTMQERESMTITSNDTNITRSQQLEQAIPPSRIASLSSGEFVGMVADNPDQPIDLKMFCCRVLNDHKALAEETARYEDLPVIRNVTPRNGRGKLSSDQARCCPHHQVRATPDRDQPGAKTHTHRVIMIWRPNEISTCARSRSPAEQVRASVTALELRQEGKPPASAHGQSPGRQTFLPKCVLYFKRIFFESIKRR